MLKFFINLLLNSIVSLLLFSNINSHNSNIDNQINNNADYSDQISFIIKNLTQAIIVNKHSELVELVKDSETNYFVYYYLNSSKNCYNGLRILKELEPKIEYLLKYVLINCELEEFSNRSVCQKIENAPDSFPRMIRLDPPKVRINPYTNEQNRYNETVFRENNVNAKSLYTFITAGITDYSIDLNNNNIDDFLYNDPLKNKLLLFTDKDKTPLLYKGLSSYFYDRLTLGTVRNNQKDIFNRFKIQKLPILMIYATSINDIILKEPVVDIYSGEINARSIISSVEFLANNEKSYITERTKGNLENDSKFNSNDNNNNNDNYGIIDIIPQTLEYFLTRFASKSSFFIVGNKQLKDNNEISLEIKQIAKETAGYTMFYYLDCSNKYFKDFITKFLLNKSCPEVDDNDNIDNLKSNNYKLMYLDAYSVNNTIDDIKEKFIDINDYSYNNLEKIIYDKYEHLSTVKEIIDEEYDYTIKKSRKDNKIPLFYLDYKVR